MAEKGRKPRNVGRYNNTIVAHLLLEKPYSCIEMSEKIKLTHTTTGMIVDRLLNMDLIRICVENNPVRTRGRQHVRYEINPDRAFMVCVNFQHHMESLTICNLSGEVLLCEKMEDENVDDAYLDELIAKIMENIKRLKLSMEKLAVVSIAVPGRIDSETGEVIVSSKIRSEVNLKEKFQSQFPTAVIDIKNDIVYACMGSLLSEEFDYEGGSHLYTYFGFGLACCLIYDKKIVEGSNGFGGEIGMNVVGKDGAYLDEMISIVSLLRLARTALQKEDVSWEEFIQSSREHPLIQAKLLEIAEVLGYAMRNIVDIAGCSHIIFSGQITQFPEYFFEEFDRVLRSANYSSKISYRIDFSRIDAADQGQMYLSRITAMDWVMRQYNN